MALSTKAKLAVALAATLAAFAGLVTGSKAASASVVGPWEIINQDAGGHMCLDAVAAHDGTSGDHVVLWRCKGSSNQLWYLDQYSNGNIVFKNARHGLCLDARAQQDGTNGDLVQLWRCNGWQNQNWYEPLDGTPGNTFIPGFVLENRPHGLCLDAIRQHDRVNGDGVQLWRCNGGSNQHWNYSYSTP
jgi:alpha-galactosidase